MKDVMKFLNIFEVIKESIFIQRSVFLAVAVANKILKYLIILSPDLCKIFFMLIILQCLKK